MAGRVSNDMMHKSKEVGYSPAVPFLRLGFVFNTRHLRGPQMGNVARGLGQFFSGIVFKLTLNLGLVSHSVKMRTH